RASLARRAVAVRGEGQNRGCRERVARGADVRLRSGPSHALDVQTELLGQLRLDVGTPILGAPAESDDFLQADIDVAVPRDGRSGIRRVVRLVRAGWQVNGAGEAAQAVGFAARIHGAQIPHDRAGARIENPRGRGPGRLLVVLPVLIVTTAQPVRPRLRADGRQFEVLRRREDEATHPVFPGAEVLTVD